MKIIGLTGFAKSGKSTAAEILRNLGGQEVAFAKHLKDVSSVVLEVPRDHFDNQAFKEVPFLNPIVLFQSQIDKILHYFDVPPILRPDIMIKHDCVTLTSPRHVAQYIGTEILRSVDQNIHIKTAFKLNQGSTAKFLVCSDVRFDNELKAVQDAGGIVIGISRSAATPADIQNLHPSEREIPDLIARSNRVAYNELTIQQFQEYIKIVAFEFLEQK